MTLDQLLEQYKKKYLMDNYSELTEYQIDWLRTNISKMVKGAVEMEQEITLESIDRNELRAEILQKLGINI